MLVIRQKMIYREDLRNNLDVFYIFGDNLARTGMGGQAKEMRGEPNAFGVATKRRPSHGSREDYFFDDDATALGVVEHDFDVLEEMITNFNYTSPETGDRMLIDVPPVRAIVIPADGIGTGLAKLTENAPKLLRYINMRLKELEKL